MTDWEKITTIIWTDLHALTVALAFGLLVGIVWGCIKYFSNATYFLLSKRFGRKWEFRIRTDDKAIGERVASVVIEVMGRVQKEQNSQVRIADAEEEKKDVR